MGSEASFSPSDMIDTEDVMDTREAVYGVVSSMLEDQGRGDFEFTDETIIQEGGLEFDSLTVAEFSAGLEQKLQKDPYTCGEFPITVGDVIAFYK
jgi:hypothetical protein